MKYTEFHRIIRRNGWRFLHARGSHYHYEKDGRVEVAPFHGADEMREALRKTLVKRMGLK
ncbi:MAG: type II toxin-antitoxin system HicA family toxin [Tannerellaceae bacterium]|nr:type II toxin-antitoxin system HicA family toxin [Tannerellaceae bacterium]